MNVRFGTIADLVTAQEFAKGLFTYAKDRDMYAYINPEWSYQPAGITFLTEHLQGKDTSAARFALHAHLPNTSAIALYQELGFKEVAYYMEAPSD